MLDRCELVIEHVKKGTSDLSKDHQTLSSKPKVEEVNPHCPSHSQHNSKIPPTHPESRTTTLNPPSQTMKFPTVHLLTLLPALSLAADCVVQRHGTYSYIITAAQPIPDVSGVCGGLWDNLKGWSQCAASATFCGVKGELNDLKWEFTVPSICNSGMVESAWWEATRNAYGGVTC